jgi:hypothetical protein
MGKIIVVYGGGFQPFHAGHLSSYLQAKQKFGKLPNVDFYVTASDNTNTRPIPFKEKQWLAKQAGVSEQDFRDIIVKSPLNPVEILSQYDPDNDIFILVRSERDPVGYTKKDGSPGYYQPFININKCVPFNSKTGGHGYVFVTKKEEFVIAGQKIYSGTQVRNMYASADNDLRNQIVHDMYPNSPNELAIRKVLDKYIGATDSETVTPKTSQINKLKSKQLAERISIMRPLIKEASVEQKYKFLKLMKEAYQLNELNLFKKKKVEIEPEVKVEPESDVNDYHAYFKLPTTEPEVYHSPQEYLEKNKVDVLSTKKKQVNSLDEITKQEAIKQYNDVKNYKPVERPKEKEKEFLKITLGRPKKEQNTKTETVDETRIYYTDGKTRVNLYYVPPKLKAQGKVQNIAHNIPYSTVDILIKRLCEKYNITDEYFTWIPTNADRTGTNIKNLPEDYIDEK